MNPDGDVVLDWSDWWSTDESLSEALLGYNTTQAFNWPIRDVDHSMSGGLGIMLDDLLAAVYAARLSGSPSEPEKR